MIRMTRGHWSWLKCAAMTMAITLASSAWVFGQVGKVAAERFKENPIIHIGMKNIHHYGFKNINVCSNSRSWGQLSPMKLGPVEHDEKDENCDHMPPALNLENLWQSNKV